MERTVATRTDQIAVSGRIDRLDERPPRPAAGRELVVVDYKTGRRPLTTDDARTSMPLALYALAAGAGAAPAAATGWSCITCRPATVLAWEHTDESLGRQLGRAEDIAAECAAADERFRDRPARRQALDETFPPRPGPGCGWCDYRAQCPEGPAAAPRPPALGRAGAEPD